MDMHKQEMCSIEHVLTVVVNKYMGLYMTFREEQQSRSTRKRTKDTNSSR